MDNAPKMENQMEREMENEMETGIVAQFIGARLFGVYAFRIFSRGTDAFEVP